jgi:hypothetical protein
LAGYKVYRLEQQVKELETENAKLKDVITKINEDHTTKPQNVIDYYERTGDLI